MSFKNLSPEKIIQIEMFVRSKLKNRLLEHCRRSKITITEEENIHILGVYKSDIENFKFNDEEKSMINQLVVFVENSEMILDQKEKDAISEAWNSHHGWFWENENRCLQLMKPTMDMPIGAKNCLGIMLQIAKRNANRSKHGYRYPDEFKRFTVHHRMLAGRQSYNMLHGNLDGCLPSISTTNRYIHRSDHMIIEGELRCEELLLYLRERDQPMWVILSEDATRVENRIQYDSRSNQIIGFVLPTNKEIGMPIPFTYKARSASEMIQHFSNDLPIAHYVNTVMAQPIGNAPPFCLIVFGCDNRHTADEVARRWKYISNELEKIGIGVLCTASDSDPRYNCAMRRNSLLGCDSGEFTKDGLFKCGDNIKPPHYIQDYPHLGTKLRNLLVKSIGNPNKLPFGNFFIQMEHLYELMNRFDKDKHSLTETILNPVDKQNFDSVLKICDQRVISLLKREVRNSEATVIYLQIISNMIDAFMDQKLSPKERLRKLWYSLFIVRIWRHFITSRKNLRLKYNFLSSYTYYCIELNAHSLVLILLFLKKKKLTHLFAASLLCSQPCEQFYRQIRSFTSTYSTVANCSVKEMLSRISRIQLQNDISNDKNSGFIYPKASRTNKLNDIRFTENDFPDEHEIMEIIQMCQENAVICAIKIGLLPRNQRDKKNSCICRVPAYVYEAGDSEDCDNYYLDQKNTDTVLITIMRHKLISSTLKNFAKKFNNKDVDESSPYVKVTDGRRTIILRKSTLCGFFRQDVKKISSDRRYRVRAPGHPVRILSLKDKKQKRTK